MVNALYAFIWFAAMWKWGDWRNWRIYYPTILFFIIGDFIYLYLLSDFYPIWRYNPPDIDGSMGVTNTHVSLGIILIKYPATMLIYLSKFPDKNRKKQFIYILLWVFIYFLNEFIDRKFHLIEYHNGWNLGWSVFFNGVMFLVLKIHFHQPIFAWILSVIFILFLWNTFDVPTTVFR